MKPKIVFLIIAILMVAGITCLICDNTKQTNDSNINMSELASTTNPVVSPSGKYQLNVKEVFLEGCRQRRFYISAVSEGKKAAKNIFISKDTFRTRDSLFFTWGKRDSVWVYSGDLGAFFWECDNEGNWSKHVYEINQDSYSAPDILKKLRPKYFH